MQVSRIKTIKPAAIGKRYALKDGELEKTTLGNLYEGRLTLEDVATIDAFADLLESLEPGAEVLAYGVPHAPVPTDGLSVVTQAQIDAGSAPAGAITRSDDCLRWGEGAGIVMLDYDPDPETSAMGAKEIWNALCAACPALKEVAALWWPSSSSHIFEGGKELVGLSGQRFYFAARDASDIPRAMKVLEQRLWLTGQGRIMITAHGHMLPRTLIDGTVFQPSRIDFAAGAVCAEGLEQNRGEVRMVGGRQASFDTRAALPELSREELADYAALKRSAKAKAQPAAKAQRAAWVEDRLSHEAKATLGEDTSPEELNAALRDLEAKGRRKALEAQITTEQTVLELDSIIWLDWQTSVRVRDILENPKDYQRRAVCDPLEPEYQNYKKCATVYADSRHIVGHAHGARKIYVLGTNEEFEAVERARHAAVHQKAADHLAELEQGGDILGPNSMQAFLFGTEEDRARLEQIALDQRKLTEWRKRIAAYKGLFGAAPALPTPKPDPDEDAGFERESFDVSDPATYSALSARLRDRLGAARLVFDYGGQPVVLLEKEQSAGRAYKRGADGKKVLDANGEPEREAVRTTFAERVTRDMLLSLSDRFATYYVVTSKGPKPVDMPDGLLRRLAADARFDMPTLNGLVTHPVMRGGKLLTGQNEYDRSAKLWLNTGVVEVEQWTDPHAAYHFLTRDWLGDFPFEYEKDRAFALMLMGSLMTAKTDLLTVEGPPLFAVTAPAASIGKSFLVSILQQAVTGQPAPASNMPSEKAERDKVIAAKVLDGSTLMNLDNVPTGSTVGNSYTEILSLTTNAVFSGRVLGASKHFAVPHGLVVVVSGNNLIFVDDMASRTIEIRMVPKEGQNLALRSFTHSDLAGWTLEYRDRILGALACIMGQRADVRAPVGRFHTWARVVAEPILAAAELAAKDAFSTWLEAGIEDAKGKGVEGFGELLRLIRKIKVEDKIQPKQGHWLTAAEIAANEFVHQFIAFTFHGYGLHNPKALAAFLKRHRDLQSDDGLRLRMGRENLGTRTKRLARLVFRVEQLTDAPLDTPATVLTMPKGLFTEGQGSQGGETS